MRINSFDNKTEIFQQHKKLESNYNKLTGRALRADSFKKDYTTFTSKPSGVNCTRLFRTNAREFTDFTINHFQKRINDNTAKKIKVVSHFGSDGSEIYTYILSLIKTLGYEKVKSRFIFESRDFDAKIIKEAKNRDILLINHHMKSAQNDFTALLENVGDSIKINGKEINILDLFKPISKNERSKLNEPHGFEHCKVHPDLANLVKFKQQNIKDFSDNDIDIFLARNQFCDLLENNANQYDDLVEKIHKKINPDALFVVSKYDLNKSGLKNQCEKSFKSEPICINNDIIYTK